MEYIDLKNGKNLLEAGFFVFELNTSMVLPINNM